MTRRCFVPAFLAAHPLATQVAAQAQTADRATDYKTSLPHPRLWLPARRKRLIEREAERATLRWTAFQTLMAGRVKFPEPGLANALYYVAAKSEPHGRAAIDWALAHPRDLRQVAVVFDWCNALLSPAESKKLIAALAAGIEKGSADTLPEVSAGMLAAFAIADHVPDTPERFIRNCVEGWWKTAIIAKIEAGESPIDQKDHLALIEMLHALRDNLDIDLREQAAKFFVTLPIYHILAHYPAPLPAAENDFRIPLMSAHAEPDLTAAARSRAAGLAMVAFDTNSQEMQFLQGWLINDRFLMRGAYGIPYEFLWANPYQPGLSYHYLPNVLHDPARGRLLIRSTWEDNAVWYYQQGNARQIFDEGKIVNLGPGGLEKEIVMGNTVLLPGALSEHFSIATEDRTRYYVTGLKPEAIYALEVDDEEIRDVRTDRGGVAELVFPPKRTAVVLLRPAGVL